MLAERTAQSGPEGRWGLRHLRNKEAMEARPGWSMQVEGAEDQPGETC